MSADAGAPGQPRRLPRAERSVQLLDVAERLFIGSHCPGRESGPGVERNLAADAVAVSVALALASLYLTTATTAATAAITATTSATRSQLSAGSVEAVGGPAEIGDRAEHEHREEKRRRRGRARLRGAR